MVRTIIVDPRFPALLAELRRERGMSLRDLAGRAYISHTTIRDLETGGKNPSMQTARSLDKALAGGGRLAGLVTEMEPIAAVTDPMWRVDAVRRSITDALTAATLSAASVDEWQRIAIDYGRATRYRPAVLLVDELMIHFAELAAVLQHRHPASVMRDLTRVTAQMAGMMFLSLIKIDQPVAARAWARTANLAAIEAGDSAVHAWVRAQEAFVHFYVGDMAEALTVADHARRIAGSQYCPGAALAAALEARAHGVRGDARAVLTAVDAAGSVLDGLPPDDLAPSAFGYNAAQLAFHAGNAYTHLGDTSRAWSAQQRALTLYDTDEVLDRTLVHLDRTECLVRDGDVTDGFEYGIAELSALTHMQRTGLINGRAREVLAMVPAATQVLPAAAGFAQLLDEGTGS